jgi:NAD+ synthase
VVFHPRRAVPAEDVASFLQIPAAQAAFVYKDIIAKRLATRYLHARPMLVEQGPEIPA